MTTMTNHPSFSGGSNGSGTAITLRDLIALRDQYAPEIDVDRDGDGWMVDGEHYDTGEAACEAIRAAK